MARSGPRCGNSGAHLCGRSAAAQRYEKPVEANQRGYRSAVLGKDVTTGRARRASGYVAIAGWHVRSFVDLNASDDLEGKTEIGKSTLLP